MPEIGRWASRDPIEEKGDLMLYCYLKNAPQNWIDSSGMSVTGPLADTSDNTGVHTAFAFIIENGEHIVEISLKAGAQVENAANAASANISTLFTYGKTAIEMGSATGNLNQFPRGLVETLGKELHHAGDRVKIPSSTFISAGLNGVSDFLSVYDFVTSKGARDELIAYREALDKFLANRRCDTCQDACSTASDYIRVVPGMSGHAAAGFFLYYCTLKCCKY